MLVILQSTTQLLLLCMFAVFPNRSTSQTHHRSQICPMGRRATNRSWNQGIIDSGRHSRAAKIVSLGSRLLKFGEQFCDQFWKQQLQIRESRQKPQANIRFWKLPTYPSLKPTLTLTCHLWQNVGLGEGQVGSFPGMYNDQTFLLHRVFFFSISFFLSFLKVGQGFLGGGARRDVFFFIPLPRFQRQQIIG